MNTDIVPANNELFIAPVIDVAGALQRYQAVKDFIGKVLHEGTDYGVVPGSTKPTLLKPGAEKMTAFFGFTVKFIAIESIEDWTGADHVGEPFFYYRYRCQLWRGETMIAEGEGSCNSWEKKYRYRKLERTCPTCGQPTVIKGKAEFGGGWLCWKKKGGCGATYPDGDPKIETQEVGEVKNPDPADGVNTYQKMAQKRALIAPVLIATNTSEYFTQDIEDFVQGEIVEAQVASPESKRTIPDAEKDDLELIDPLGQRAVELAALEWNISKSKAAQEIAKRKLGNRISKEDFMAIVKGGPA